ncbi:CD225/dispanin family protein [Kitasatospora sp. NPDC047058]|uniref:CD225/dispanin family protein n=1 Tax=Kitasatospora sp. NPDC047058 TaxID=3155620 RepID=UPI0033EC71E6
MPGPPPGDGPASPSPPRGHRYAPPSADERRTAQSYPTEQPPHQKAHFQQSGQKPVPPPGTRPKTYWALSIIAFVLFFPIGALGMYFSAQVTSRWLDGAPAGAKSASTTALVLDLCFIAIGLIFWIAIIIAAASSGSSDYTDYNY